LICETAPGTVVVVASDVVVAAAVEVVVDAALVVVVVVGSSPASMKAAVPAPRMATAATIDMTRWELTHAVIFDHMAGQGRADESLHHVYRPYTTVTYPPLSFPPTTPNATGPTPPTPLR
jgi:hypothetical protein